MLEHRYPGTASRHCDRLQSEQLIPSLKYTVSQGDIRKMHCCIYMLSKEDVVMSAVKFPTGRIRKKKTSDVRPILFISLRIYSVTPQAILLNFSLVQPCLELRIVVGVNLTEQHISNDAHVAQGQKFCIALRNCHFHKMHKLTCSCPEMKSLIF